jgi:hypothetical protein
VLYYRCFTVQLLFYLPKEILGSCYVHSERHIRKRRCPFFVKFCHKIKYHVYKAFVWCSAQTSPCLVVGVNPLQRNLTCVSSLLVSSDLPEKEKDVMAGKYKRVQSVGIDEVREIGRKSKERIRKDVKVGIKRSKGNNCWDESEKHRDIDYYFSLCRSNLEVHSYISLSLTSKWRLVRVTSGDSHVPDLCVSSWHLRDVILSSLVEASGGRLQDSSVLTLTSVSAVLSNSRLKGFSTVLEVMVKEVCKVCKPWLFS